MTVPLHTRPRLETAIARAILQERFDRRGELAPLPSERDQNFRVRDPDGGPGWLLKIANAADPDALLEMQEGLLEHLGRAPGRFAFPRLTAPAVRIEEAGARYRCQLFDWVPGAPLADCDPRPLPLLEEIGNLMATVAGALLDFEHPAATRPLQWDLRHTEELCAERAPAVNDPERRALLDRWLARLSGLGERLAAQRQSVIQNDANDHNILCGPVADVGDGWRRRVVGLVDFGDAIASATLVECAVAMAYAMLGRRDPLAAAAAVARGFHATLPLDEEEIALLIEGAAARLCLSVCNSAVQRPLEPDNDYLSVSERDAWDALGLLERNSPVLAEYRLRAACGLEPCPRSGRVRRWLEEEASPRPIVEPAGGVHVFDLGVGSTEMGGGAPGAFATAPLTERLFGLMAERDADLGIGRWDEARCWYGGELFAAPDDERPLRRTVHIGLDLFQPAGSPLRAPIAGRVAAATWNRGRLDYGPTLILEHEPEPELRFWTLWGHLDPECLERWQPGDEVAAGELLAHIGDFPDNGDWPPHLHLQVICDRLDYAGDFPGVVTPDDRPVWMSLSPDPWPLLGLSPPDGAAGTPLDASPLPAAALIERRRSVLGASLSLSYRRPLHIVRGWRQYLYAADGQPYLDAVNNVPHVGHSHPSVVAAAARQNELLNTNTRYLHESLLDYAERLAALLPSPLAVVYLVCSGSEANELAVRMARAHTGRRDMVVVEGGYHGNTSTLIELSHYKHAGPGGTGPPDWVHVAAMPDPYRGIHREADDPGLAYAGEVAAACGAAEQNGGPAGLLIEPLLGCGGQIVPPEGYLEAAFDAVRAAGGVTIADEVQIGFGRVGSHLWAFEQQGAVPDIVTLGKPIGNGYPLAAVVTTPEIAASFANGMEYFNTFGGNPVACEVGLAVLDVLERERLAANARDVGERLLTGLGELAERHPLIGDVRGVGLYVGIELVRDRESREPAALEAAYVVNRLRERGILTSTDGPDHDVVKIKPPLCFDAADADRLVEQLDAVLREDLPRPVQPRER